NDPTIYDGRFANNGWLQELPKPLTKVTWDNVALISPKTAYDLYGLRDNGGATTGREHYVAKIDVIHRGRTLSGIPLWILPGQPDNVIGIQLGYGRRQAGRVGNQRGVDAYTIRTSDAPWSASGVQLRKTMGEYELATTQLHFALEDLKFSDK